MYKSATQQKMNRVDVAGNKTKNSNKKLEYGNEKR